MERVPAVAVEVNQKFGKRRMADSQKRLSHSEETQAKARATERALLEEGGGHEAEGEDEQGKKSGGEAIGV